MPAGLASARTLHFFLMGGGVFPLQCRFRHQDSDTKARLREACKRKLQKAAEVAEWIAGRVALAMTRGSGWQPSERLVGVCCNTLDALLGESFRVWIL